MAPHRSFVKLAYFWCASQALNHHPSQVDRRRMLAAGTLLVPTLASSKPTTDVAIDFGVDGTGAAVATASFQVPPSWQGSDTRQASGLGGRRIIVYSDPNNADTNAFLLLTPVRGDYTSLGSFGTLDSVQDTIIPSGPNIVTDVLTAKTSPGRYNYEYTIEVPDQPKRHLNTIFALTADTIVTFTTQATASDYDGVVSDLSAIASTFKIDPKKM